jgi:hypothetical protein
VKKKQKEKKEKILPGPRTPTILVCMGHHTPPASPVGRAFSPSFFSFLQFYLFLFQLSLFLYNILKMFRFAIIVQILEFVQVLKFVQILKIVQLLIFIQI